MIALLVALPVGAYLLLHKAWPIQRAWTVAADLARLTAPLPQPRKNLGTPVPRRKATRRMVQIAATRAEPIPDGVDVHPIGGRWPQRQTPTDLANAYYQPAHAHPSVADTPLSYRGRHHMRDVTGEFHAIVRASFPDQLAVSR